MDGIVSVIVPVYNARNTLTRCVESLVHQTYEKLEIILVNDGSKDDSLALCKAFAEQDTRIRVIDKPNGGVSSARNAGIEAATGEYIMFCDSDDWVDQDWCAELVAHYQPECLTVCEIAWDDEVEAAQNAVHLVVAERKEALHHFMVMCSPVNKIFCRDLLERKSLRFSGQLSIGEDFCFAMEYISTITGNIRIVKRKLYHYDTSTDGSLSKKIPQLEQCELFYQKLTRCMEIIGATDMQSVQIRNRFVMGHFERILESVAMRKDISFSEKHKIAADIEKMESFRSCCGGIEWGNPLCKWLYHIRSAGGVVCYLQVRKLLKGR